jgi:hemin uptake protein HemP
VNRPEPADARDGLRPPPRLALRSEELFRGAREVLILHRDVEYRLRITRAGKLILTK